MSNGRGKELAEDLGIRQKSYDDSEIAAMLDKALGGDGTKLCCVDRVEQGSDTIKIYTRETLLVLRARRLRA